MMSSDDDDQSVPTYEWLNELLFEPIFEKELNLNRTEFALRLTSIKPAVGTGENYVAQVTRVQVEVTLKNSPNLNPKAYSFIIKSKLSHIKEMDNCGPLDKELAYYANIVPKLLKFDAKSKFAPVCYFTSNEFDKSIILEDLSVSGYKMGDRFKGLDFDHCKVFFKKLGEYHAITTACYEKNGEFEKMFHVSRYGIQCKPLHTTVIKLMFPEFLKIFTKYEHLKPYYAKVKVFEDKLYDTMQQLTDIKIDEFNVLNHGDSWVNNLLFTYDKDNHPKDVLLVDHQLSMIGTPVFDIFYFFISSPNLEVREKHFDDLVLLYHENLVKTLKKFNYQKHIPTLHELHKEILKKGPITCFMLFLILGFTQIASDETGPLNILFKDCDEGKRIRYNFYNNPRYLQVIEPALKFIEQRGFLIK